MRILRDISVKRKLILLTMVTSGIALLLSSAAFLVYDIVTYQSNAVRGLSILAEVIGSNRTAALSLNDPRAAAE